MADNALGKAKNLCVGAYLHACSITTGSNPGGPPALSTIFTPIVKLLLSKNEPSQHQPNTTNDAAAGGIRLG